MKNHLLLVATGMILLGSVGFAWAQCPEDTIDSGICDTLYVKFHDPRQDDPPPWEVHVPILVTHDLPDPVLDSIAGFVIPLKIIHTNPAVYCSIPAWKNSTQFYPDTANSIFRHFEGMENRMMSLYEQGNGAEWDNILLDIQHDASGDVYFWLFMAPGYQDPKWWEGSKTLLATITLFVEDSTTICIDTCFWPPNSHLSFTRWGDAKQYVSRHFMPVYQKIFFPTPPWFYICPDQDQQHNTNGHFASEGFEAWGQTDDIVDCKAEFFGQGVDNVTIHYHDGMSPPGDIVRGHVEYDVIDHFQSGGYIRIGIVDTEGEWAYCSFNVVLSSRGDCNGDGVINSADVVYLINYLFAGGPAPDPLSAGDANSDGVVNSADVVYLINYLFAGGPPPSC